MGSAVKGTGCSCSGPGMGSQHPHGDSQSVTLVEGLASPSGLRVTRHARGAPACM